MHCPSWYSCCSPVVPQRLPGDGITDNEPITDGGGVTTTAGLSVPGSPVDTCAEIDEPEAAGGKAPAGPTFVGRCSDGFWSGATLIDMDGAAICTLAGSGGADLAEELGALGVHVVVLEDFSDAGAAVELFTSGGCDVVPSEVFAESGVECGECVEFPTVPVEP